MIFRQLFDPVSSTYTCLLGDSHSRQAVIVDPVRKHAQRDLGLLAQLGLKLVRLGTRCTLADADGHTSSEAMPALRKTASRDLFSHCPTTRWCIPGTITGAEA